MQRGKTARSRHPRGARFVLGEYTAAYETAIRSNTLLDGGYDPISRPKATTEVRVGIGILAIDQLDLRNQMFTFAGWMEVEWRDERLKWTPAAGNGNIESVFSTSDIIWKPELVIDNALEDLGVITADNLNLRYDFEGDVKWEPPRLFNVHCQVDVTFYPYDQQKCSIVVIGWSYTVEEVDLAFLSKAINTDDLETHGEWIVTQTETVKAVLEETLEDGTKRRFPQLEFWISIQRRHAFYNLNVIMPVVVTSLLIALTFIVPFESGEKLSYILTVFLSLVVLLTVTADALPPTSITVSNLAMYLGIVTVLSAVGMLTTVLLLMVYHNEDGISESTSASSECILLIARVAATLICSSKRHLIGRRVSSKVVKVVPVNGHEHAALEQRVKSAESGKKGADDEKANVTWQDVAIILDRFVFIVFLAVTVAINFGFLVGLVVGGKTTVP
ncbi:neuronal acetylcholine receptor subunit alpha-2-like [Dreissena polymorpha]|uniref:neuronal acetylcholine receptor subunit alpha-2-like n=1 Tax=Dreissena polymorpha TaxID=45954 RepID=UPI0022646329|nr:neuronal acetylcholine receptor subunit alpha-2-like [Dreissena polymorpha]